MIIPTVHYSENMQAWWISRSVLLDAPLSITFTMSILSWPRTLLTPDTYNCVFIDVHFIFRSHIFSPSIYSWMFYELHSIIHQPYFAESGLKWQLQCNNVSTYVTGRKFTIWCGKIFHIEDLELLNGNTWRLGNDNANRTIQIYFFIGEPFS